jgi:hypothetical protein
VLAIVVAIWEQLIHVVKWCCERRRRAASDPPAYLPYHPVLRSSTATRPGFRRSLPPHGWRRRRG